MTSDGNDLTEPVDAEPHDPLAERIAELVASRRDAGRYPPGLEAELDGMQAQAVRRSLVEFDRRLADARGAVSEFEALGPRPFQQRPVTTSSKLPGGQVLHAVVGSTVNRHMQVMVDQLNDVTEVLHRTVVALANVLPELATLRGELISQLDGVDQQLAGIARALAATADG